MNHKPGSLEESAQRVLLGEETLTEAKDPLWLIYWPEDHYKGWGFREPIEVVRAADKDAAIEEFKKTPAGKKEVKSGGIWYVGVSEWDKGWEKRMKDELEKAKKFEYVIKKSKKV